MASPNIQDVPRPKDIDKIQFEIIKESAAEYSEEYDGNVLTVNGNGSNQQEGGVDVSKPGKDIEIEYEIASNELIYKVCDVPPLRVSLFVALQQLYRRVPLGRSCVRWPKRYAQSQVNMQYYVRVGFNNFSSEQHRYKLTGIRLRHRMQQWKPALRMKTSSMSVILSMYLAKYKIPIPAWTPKKGFHTIRTSLHATFSVSYFGFSVNFSVSTLISFFIATLASIVDSIADYYACAKICDVPIPPNHSVNRGIVIDGLATAYAGGLGIGHGTSTYGGNIGAIAITRVASRRVFQIVGVIYMLFGIIGYKEIDGSVHAILTNPNFLGGVTSNDTTSVAICVTTGVRSSVACGVTTCVTTYVTSNVTTSDTTGVTIRRQLVLQPVRN
ncbi:solute carrier family 23 member 1-like isoform X1 [Octopus vulgaris]|uniref:Solute carrier family 23 member 1-like isoform X1 n=1 Tax=Octopus vulgaris TaxID=6645 RepID=A0AA36FJ13_OCTVU|nr:solute carrier family 23 member 1-like isoform X1 [Octopus vulgaris]